MEVEAHREDGETYGIPSSPHPSPNPPPSHTQDGEGSVTCTPELPSLLYAQGEGRSHKGGTAA